MKTHIWLTVVALTVALGVGLGSVLTVEAKERKLSSTVQKAKTQFDEGNYKEAVSALAKRVDRHPQDWDAWILLGHCYMMQEDYTKAVLTYIEAKKEKPTRLDTYRYLGRAYIKRGLFGNAIDNFDFVVMNDPKDLEARLSIGFSNIQLGKYKEATRSYEAALVVEPNNSTALLNLGQIAEEYEKDYPKAEDYYLRFLEQHPDNSLAGQAKSKLEKVREYLTKRELLGDDAVSGDSASSTGTKASRKLPPVKLNLFGSEQRGVLVPIISEAHSDAEREDLTEFLRASLFEQTGLTMISPLTWKKAWAAQVAAEGAPCYEERCLKSLATALEANRVVVCTLRAVGADQSIVIEMYDGATGKLLSMSKDYHRFTDLSLRNSLESAVSAWARKLATQ